MFTRPRHHAPPGDLPAGTTGLLAAEADGTYDAAGSPTAARMAEAVTLVQRRDRTMARLLGLLVSISGADELAEVTGGMTLHVWLQHAARCTHAEARDLLGTAEVVRDLPTVVAGLGDGWLSWSQVTAIARAARRVPVADRSDLDRLVGDAMVAHRDWEPDALVDDVWQWVDARQPSRLQQAEAAAERDRFLTLSPRLFGGGSLYGELDTIGFATVAEALDAPLGPPVAPPDDLADTDAVDAAFDQLDAQRRALTKHHGRRLADRLVALCEADLGGGAADPDARATARPLLLATVDLDALLDATRTPGWLLHTLAGGHMKVSSDTLQRLVDQRGADVRTIVFDDSRVVGVGRRTAIPPGWLREAVWATHVAVNDPEGTTPVRRADLDHEDPWPDGPTDADNLQPLGRRWHNHKTTGAWTVRRSRDGTTTWRHRRHGWTIRLAPSRRDLADPPDRGPPRLPLDSAAGPGTT